jgi:hypothetical protein
MQTALVIGSVALALGALVAALFLPARALVHGVGDDDGDGGDADGRGEDADRDLVGTAT